MKAAIIGTGYVGLTTGTCLAELGHDIICVDNDPAKLEKLNKGESPIFEPGLEELIKKNMKDGKLTFTADIGPAVEDAQVIFICVNTPPKEDGQADLKYVEIVAREIAEKMNGDYKVIVDKSTVPVKTAEKVKEIITKHSNDDSKFDVISNPEFLKEGTAVEDTLRPDRIVIGVDSKKAEDIILELYKPLIDATNAPVKITSVRSAELIKHGANTFLAMKISFANLIAETCEEAGANAQEVLEAIGLDDRIGSKFLNPGIGFGGSCFPKDIAAYKKTLEMLDIDNAFVQAIEDVNEQARVRFLQRLEKELWVIDGKNIGILGLAFKPNTDDIRNSPALKIIEKLKQDGANIKAYDPEAMDNAKEILSDITYCENAQEVAKDADALVICTEWDEFKNLNLEETKSLMNTPMIFDGRNAINEEAAKKAGFKYMGVGK